MVAIQRGFAKIAHMLIRDGAKWQVALPNGVKLIDIIKQKKMISL